MGGSAASLDNYIDMINDILVRQVLVEEDRHVIRVVSKDIHSRLSALSLYLKAEQGGKYNFRKAIAKVCCHIGNRCNILNKHQSI